MKSAILLACLAFILTGCGSTTPVTTRVAASTQSETVEADLSRPHLSGTVSRATGSRLYVETSPRREHLVTIDARTIVEVRIDGRFTRVAPGDVDFEAIDRVDVWLDRPYEAYATSLRAKRLRFHPRTYSYYPRARSPYYPY